MPRVKPPQQFGGLDLVLRENLQKYIAGVGVPFTSDEILTLIRVADYPNYLSSYRLYKHTVTAFGVLFAKWPGEVLDILVFIRAKLDHYNNTKAGRVTVFLRTHSSIRNNKGRFLVANMTDGEIAEHLTPLGFIVMPDDVKKARQRIAREDREINVFSEPLQIQRLMQGERICKAMNAAMNAGRPNAKPKRLLRSQGKGKN